MENQKYICVVCNLVYDPVAGLPEDGIAPGTAFADIPDDWACPDCGVSKDDFEPLMEEAA
ncbi:MAG: rubredoxin [Rhodospirillales bacterium]|nr:rubredoxin [Rhodospirillales bacterium]MCW8862693.1 rubredoxin [Rhodospirillales bacterium]MCW8970792.1 rubredoxin [Rhodospirillales bacterium]MCW9002890.1 rubredoxin [Rhodospirillales bacterium]MCW9039182.1 rubredoxin [Rhodospirillales bacterium]